MTRHHRRRQAKSGTSTGLTIRVGASPPFYDLRREKHAPSLREKRDREPRPIKEAAISQQESRDKLRRAHEGRVVHIGPTGDVVAIAERMKASNDPPFDAVIFDEALERCDNLREALASARRIIGPAGLVIAQFSIAFPMAGNAQTLDYQVRATLEEDQSVFALDAEVLEEIFCSAGFRTEIDGSVVWGTPISADDFDEEFGRKVEAAFSALRAARRRIILQRVELATLRTKLDDWSKREATAVVLEAEIVRLKEAVAMLQSVVRNGSESAT